MTDIVERLRDYGLTLDENVIVCDRRVVDEAADMLARLLAGNSSSLSEARATGRREGLSEAAKWHDDECHRLHQQIKENLRYMSTHGLRGSDANDSCREEIITHKISAAAIRAAMEKEE
jgi:hypothetical protein